MIKFHDELGRKMVTLMMRTNLLSMSTLVICKETSQVFVSHLTIVSTYLMVFQFLRHFWNGNTGFFPDESDITKKIHPFLSAPRGNPPSNYPSHHV